MSPEVSNFALQSLGIWLNNFKKPEDQSKYDLILITDEANTHLDKEHCVICDSSTIKWFTEHETSVHFD